MPEPGLDPFRIRAHVANFDALVDAYRGRSRATRERLPMRADIAYGERPAERFDVFLPSPSPRGAPVHLYIHGGYWRLFGKDDFSYIADAVTAAGAIAVILDYTLMPAVRMEILVEEVRKALAHLVDTAASLGGDPERITISGHSAGAHLCAHLIQEDQPRSVRAALLLGGLYELAPLQHSFLRDELAITDDEVRRFSPLRARYAPGAEVRILYGADETPPFREQAAAFAGHLKAAGVATDLAALPGLNHADSVLELGIPGSATALHLARVIARH